jgi:hypothetical protein
MTINLTPQEYGEVTSAPGADDQVILFAARPAGFVD